MLQDTLYSRFWQKVLLDLGYVRTEEYAKKLVNQGMILGNLLLYIEKRNPNLSSKGIITEHEVSQFVDVSLVNTHDELNLRVGKLAKDFKMQNLFLKTESI